MELDTAVLEDFKESIDPDQFIDLIELHTKLKPSGKNFSGLCPFHEEKTGSFYFFPDRNSFKCFGCDAGGDIISFVREAERLDFRGALNFIAHRLNKNLPASLGSPSRYSREVQRKHASLRDLAEEVVKAYQRELTSDTASLKPYEYLQRRGITQAQIKEWDLGYAPNGWLLRDRFHLGDLQALGLVKRNEGGFFDFFRDRIIFPIRNTYGNLAGFAGRTLDDEVQPKYLNTPESALYRKRNILYGLHAVLEARRKTKDKTVVIAEGYTDVISAHANGMTNVVAVAGTSLTQQQAKLLKRNFDLAIVALDPDAAGERRTPDAAKELMHHGMRVRVLQLPPGRDLDELVRAEGPINVRTEATVNLYDFILDTTAGDVSSLDPDDKVDALQKLLPFLSYIGGFGRARAYLYETAKRFDLDYKVVLAAMRDFEKPRDKVTVKSAYEQAEFEALLIMIRKSDYLPVYREDLTPDHFTDPTYRAMFEFLSSVDAKALTGDLMMDVEPNPMFDSVPIPVEDVLSYCAGNNIEVERGELEEFWAKVKVSSAKHLLPGGISTHLNKAKLNRNLLELEGRIRAERDDARTVELLSAYQIIYEQFTSS